MLGRYRLRPSFLLEVAFLIAVWLIAWQVFNPPVAVLVFIIFAAYGLVFIYENWLDSVSRRERSEARRSLRKESEPERKPSESSRRTSPPPSVERPSEDTPAVAHSISERLTAKLHGRETEKEAADQKPEVGVPVAPRPAPPAASAPVVEKSVERFEGAEIRRPEPRPEPPKRDEPAPLPVAEGAPRSVSEAITAPRSEPAPAQPHSLMADIAAGPEARKAARRLGGPIGGWNIWQLERLLAAQVEPDPGRDYERSMLLVYLREFADSDGQLPPEFDDLVRESFAGLMHGPAS